MLLERISKRHRQDKAGARHLSLPCIFSAIRPSRSGVSGLWFFALCLFAFQSAGAATVKGIQRGTTTIAGGSTSRTVTINPVVTSKSILYFSSSTNDASPVNFHVAGELTNTTTLTFTRSGTGANTPKIKWQVVEFESGVFVQHGSANDGGSASEAVTLGTAVDTTRTFALVSYLNNGSAFGNDDAVSADITNSTTLTLTRGANNAVAVFKYQVVEYYDAKVTKVSESLTAGTYSTTSTISSVDVNKTMIVSGFSTGSNINADDLARVELTNGTTVTYTRGVDGGNTGQMDFITYVVEFCDATSVRHNTYSFSSGTDSTRLTIASLDYSRSAVVGTGLFGRQGSTDHTADDNMGYAWMTYHLVDGGTLDIVRAVGTSSTAEAPYQLVTFGDGYESWSYSREITLNTTSTGANVSGNVIDFPMLVRLSSDNFNFSQAESDGEDLRFAKTDGTPLEYEIERWDDVGSAAEVWVQVDTVYGNNNSQSLTMYWGKGGSPGCSDPKAVFNTANGFAGVYHLEEDGNTTAGGYLDATDNGNDGTGVNLDNTNDVTGVIGTGSNFNGSDEYIQITGLMGSPANVTLSGWANSDASSTWDEIISIGDYTALRLDGTANIDAWFYDGGWPTITNTGTYSEGGWHHFVYTFDDAGDAQKLYVNGVEVATGNDVSSISYSGLGSNTFIGRHGNGGGTLYMDGLIDEIRVSSTARSADWIKLSYENQKSLQTLVGFDEDYSTWTYSTDITINTSASGANVSSDQTDFPLLIRLDGDNFSFAQAESGGRDIRFAASDGVTALAYEIERWDDANESAVLWVKVPTVYGDNSTQFITMFWGKSDALDRSNSHGVFSSDNDYISVWHLDEDPDGDLPDAAEDATASNNHGDPVGSMTSTDHVETNWSRGWDFEGTDDLIDMGDITDMDGATTLSFSAWVKVDDLTADGMVMSKNNWSSPAALLFWRDNAAAVSGRTNTFTIEVSDGTNYARVESATGAANDNNWHYVTATYTANDAAGLKLYIDGTEDANSGESTTSVASFESNAENFRVATTNDDNNFFDGIIDEVRISSAARSSDWVKLEYETQKDGQTTVLMSSHPSSYQKTTRFTFNTTNTGADVAGNVSNIPILLRLDETTTDFSVTKSDGSDLLFLDADGTTYLPHEVVFWDKSSDTGLVWVKVPQVDGNSTSDYITMYYGCNNCKNLYGNGAVTWDGFNGVYHLKAPESEARDASDNDRTGTYTSSFPWTSGVTTPFSPVFNGTSDYIDIPDEVLNASEGMVMLWMKTPSSFSGDPSQRLAFGNLLTERVYLGLEDDGDLWARLDGSGDIGSYATSTNSWYHGALVWRSDNSGEVFIDSDSKGTTSGLGFTTGNIQNGVNIGSYNEGDDSHWHGAIGEVWISNTARSDDWIKLAYENQKLGSALFDNITAITGPVDVAGLQLWLKADAEVEEAASDAAEDGDAVLNWNDQANSNDFTQATPGKKPTYQTNEINGYPVVRFDGNDLMIGNGFQFANAAFTVFGVWKENTHVDWATLIAESASDESTNYLDLNISDTQVLSYSKAEVTTRYSDNATTDGKFMVSTYRSGAGISGGTLSELDIYLNSAKNTLSLADLTSMNTTTRTNIGGQEEFAWGMLNGDVAEILVYNSALSETDRKLVETYLLEKYGLSPPDNSAKLTATAVSGGVKLSWTRPVSTRAYADTVGIWAKTGSYPDSTRNGILVGYFTLDDSTYTWPTTYPATWYFSLQVRDSNDVWSNVTDAAQDTATIGEITKKFTFNTTASGADVATDQTNFPMLIRLTSSESEVFTQCAGVDGTHLRFIDDNGTDTLSFEVERWDSTNTLGEIWVKVPTVDGNSNTDYITLWYGGCNNVDGENVTDLWSNSFGGTYHLNEDGNTDTDGYQDASGSGNHGTGISMTSASDVTANVGIGQTFDGSADYIDLGNVSLHNNSAYTVALWVKGNYSGQLDQRVFAETSTSDDDPIFGLATDAGGANAHADLFIRDDDATTPVNHVESSDDVFDDTWNLLGFVDNAGSYSFYVNGVASGTGSYTKVSKTFTNTAIAALARASVTHLFEGEIDEVWLSTTDRSADWMKLSYENQKSGSSIPGIASPTGNEIYVDSATGNDGNSCSAAANPSTPKLTIESAIACALPDGFDTLKVLVGPGTYTDDDLTNTGQDVMIKSLDPNTPAVLNGRYGSGTATVSAGATTHLRNLIIKANTNGDYGISVPSGHDDVSIVGCRIINDGSTKHDKGIYVSGSSSIRILIGNNVIHEPVTDGIYVASSDDVNIVHNVIYGSGTTNGIISTSTGADDISITNNIIYNVDNGVYTYDTDDDVGLISNNLFHSVTNNTNGEAGAVDADDSPVTGDPLFVSTSPTSANFMKVAPGSPALDAGTASLDGNTSFSTTVSADYWGTARPVGSARDIGVYEGTGAGQTLTSEFDSLTVETNNDDTVAVYTANWKIVFREGEGAGIADLFDGDDLGTNLLGSNPLFDINLSGTTMSSKTSGYKPSVLSRNRVRAVVRQLVDFNATFSAQVDYNIYASGHIFVQATIINQTGSAQSNATLDYIVEVNSAATGFHNGGNENGYGYMTTSTRDMYFGVTEDLNQPAGPTWDGNTTLGANDQIVFDTDDIDFGAKDRFQHHFLIYLGDENLGNEKATNLYADNYSPSELSMASGTVWGERSWQDELAGQWGFDEGFGSTARDVSGNDRHGTITSGTYTSGREGGGLTFTTSTLVTVSHNAALNAALGSSYMVWIQKSGSFTGSESDARFLSKGSDLILGRLSSGNQVIFTAGGVTLTDPDNTPSDEWVHVAAVIRGGISYLYVNGVLKDVSPSTITPVSNTSDLIIGKNGANTGFAGDVDDVRIYNKALTDEEIQAVYNRGYAQKVGGYKGRANNNNRFVTTLNTSAAATRFQPVLHIDNYYGSSDVPKYVYVDGVKMSHLTDFLSVREPHPIGGYTLELQFNKTFTGTDVDIFIDDDDSTGFLGSGNKMPTLTTTVTAGDQIAIKNLSGTTFGDRGDKQWELIIDLDASTGTTDGDGGLYSWKSSEVSPNISIASATDLTGSDSVTLDQLRFDQVGLSGSEWTSPDPITFTVNDSSGTRLKITTGTMSVDGGTPDIDVARTYTIYPNGRLFVSYSITSLSAQPTTPQIYIPGLNGVLTSIDAWSTTAVTDSARVGKISNSTNDTTFHGIGLAVMNVKSNGSVVAGETAISGQAITSSEIAMNFNNTYFESTDATITVNSFIDISRDHDDANRLDSILGDVQNPASLTAVVGSAVTDDGLDFDGDGFAEGEGAYTYDASSGVAQFKFDVARRRYYPVFKISEWNTSAKPQIVFVDNQEQIEGFHYNAAVDGANNTLIIQFNHVWKGTSTKNILISLKNSLAVTMGDLEAVPGPGVDSIKWTTESEIDNLGFYILRRVKPAEGISDSGDALVGDTLWQRLNDKLIPGPKSGRSAATRDYVYLDKGVSHGKTYEYKLVAVDFNGEETVYGPVEASPLFNLTTELHGNYPNPFNPSTTIRFDLKEPTKLTLKIFNMKGQLVRTLIEPNKVMPAGKYRFVWDATSESGHVVPSGHYIYFFVTPKYKKAKKMTLLK